MGMSASQARLLSITSRMNDIELRSQQISNTKIRLADESEQVAADYTNALNKTKYVLNTYSDGKLSPKDLTLNAILASGSGYRLVTKTGKPVVSQTEAKAYKLATVSGRESSYVYAMVGKEEETEMTEEEALDDLVNKEVITKEQIDNYIERYNKMKPDNSNGNDAADAVVGLDDSLMSDASWLYEAILSGEFVLQSSSSKSDYFEGTDWSDTSTTGNTQLQIQSDNSNLAKAEAEYNAKTLKINNKEKKLDMQLKAMDTEHAALKTEMDSVKSLIKDNVDKTFNLFS